MVVFRRLALLILLPWSVSVSADELLNTTSDSVPENVSALLKQFCFECHDNETSEGGLNLTTLPWNPKDTSVIRQWVLIHDRIHKGEMPPDAESLSSKQRKQLLHALSQPIYDADYTDVQLNGRGPIRRLTRDEYEQNLRDMLKMPHLDIRDMLPPDREQHHCNRVARALDVSHIQLASYLEAADAALRQAVASGTAPRKAVTTFLPATRMFQEASTFGGREAMFYAKNSQMVPLSGEQLREIRKKNEHDPKMELAIFRSPSWPYYGYPEDFVAREAGEYRVRFSARAVRQMHDHHLRPAWHPIPMTFRARKRSGPDVSGDVRATGGIMDIQPETAEYQTTIRLKRNETFEYSLLGLPVPRAINPPNAPLYYDFPPMPEDGHPGVAFQWLELTGPIDEKSWPPQSHRVLFADLPIQQAEQGTLAVTLVSEDSKQDAIRLLHRFLKAAQRQPLPEETIKVYENLVLDGLAGGEPLSEALLAGYSAFLCSGHFVYLQEPVHHSDRNTDQVQYAVASRLSHFLTSSRPDERLMDLAAKGSLLDTSTLAAESDRLTDSRAFERFIISFTDYWLSLKDSRRDEPDARLYPEYRFDDYLIESMETETRTFLTVMVRENLPIMTLIDSDFAFVNDRLSRHYGLRPLDGSDLRKVSLPEAGPYGGLITQAAIMKITANGTTTSPVIRGAWVMDRIMGDPPPPPPASVPAIEPDVRGATSIREQLSQHTKDPACARCHAGFDPVGFALENFDIMGAWRNRYRSLGKGEKITGIDRAGHDYEYYIAGPVDAAGWLPDGRTFQNINELKKILAENPRRLARNFLDRLTVYATGTPVRFSDRPVIENILDQCHSANYRTRDLMRQLVQSRIFHGDISKTKNSANN